MAVVVDLDRDIVSHLAEDAFEWSHYPLRNVPETVFMSRTGAKKLKLPPPTLDQELSSLYDFYSPSVFDYTQLIPNSNQARRVLMKTIIKRHCHPLSLFGTFENDVLEHEWRASNTAFRKAVQAIVLFSSWDRFQLIPIPEDERVPELDESGEKFTNVDDPNSDMFMFHDGPDNKIMIHIATHLEHDYKYAVGRVIKYAKEMATTGHLTACILSLSDIVVVKVEGEGGQYSVSHTQPIRLFTLWNEDGLGLLMSVLSSATRTAPRQHMDTALPLEILDCIFQEYCSSDGMADVLNWRLACKAFNQVADQWIIPLAPLSILNFSATEIGPRLWYARDEVGNLGVWCPEALFGYERKLRYRAINRQTGKAIGNCTLEIYQESDTDTEDMSSYTCSEADSEESEE
jgi:hypothetical protein